MFQEFKIRMTLKAKKASLMFSFRKELTIDLWGLVLPSCYTVSRKENHVMNLNDVVTELYISNANE